MGNLDVRGEDDASVPISRFPGANQVVMMVLPSTGTEGKEENLLYPAITLSNSLHTNSTSSLYLVPQRGVHASWVAARWWKRWFKPLFGMGQSFWTRCRYRLDGWKLLCFVVILVYTVIIPAVTRNPLLYCQWFPGSSIVVVMNYANHFHWYGDCWESWNGWVLQYYVQCRSDTESHYNGWPAPRKRSHYPLKEIKWQLDITLLTRMVFLLFILLDQQTWTGSVTWTLNFTSFTFDGRTTFTKHLI